MDGKRAVIVHGYGATTQSHWFGWLAKELSRKGFQALVVELPDPDAPDVTAWEAALARSVGVPQASTALVGHSLGCITLLRHLVSLEPGWSARSLTLVSGFGEPLPHIPELDQFTTPPLSNDEVADVARAVGRSTVVCAADDEVVPAAFSERLATRLDSTLVRMATGGHFLDGDGWTQFPELLHHI